MNDKISPACFKPAAFVHVFGFLKWKQVTFSLLFTMAAFAALYCLQKTASDHTVRRRTVSPTSTASVLESRPRASSSTHKSSSRHLLTAMVAFMFQSGLRREQHWWAIHRSAHDRRGHWETKVQFWHRVAASTPDTANGYLDKRYLRSLRKDVRTFAYILGQTRNALAAQPTHFHQSVPPK